MKLKTLLIGLTILVISFQTFATTEMKTEYYPTGDVKMVKEFSNGKLSKQTDYYDDIGDGQVKEIFEYVNGNMSKSILYDLTGKVKQIDEYVDGIILKVTQNYSYAGKFAVDEYINGKLSKVTAYYPTGEVEAVIEFSNGKKSKHTDYYKTGRVSQVQEFINGKLSKRTYSTTELYPTGEVRVIRKFINKIVELTIYYITGEVQEIRKFINGKILEQTRYYITGEVQEIRKYINGNILELTAYYKNGEVFRDPFFDKAPNKKIKAPNEVVVMSCIGVLYNMGHAFFGSTPDSNDEWNEMFTQTEAYWGDVTITGDVLTASEFGNYLYRGEKDGKKYWKIPTYSVDMSDGNPADGKYRWAKLDLNTDKFEISKRENDVFVMQGKCSPKTKTKTKTNWN